MLTDSHLAQRKEPGGDTLHFLSERPASRKLSSMSGALVALRVSVCAGPMSWADLRVTNFTHPNSPLFLQLPKTSPPYLLSWPVSY